MNYTKNYRLPQWVKEDRIMMDDFNAMNSSIENGLTRTDAKADSANTKSDTAVQIANAAANAKPYAVGHYTATGEDQEISVGFRPSFLIISGMGDIRNYHPMLNADIRTEGTKTFDVLVYRAQTDIAASREGYLCLFIFSKQCP